MHEDQVQRVPPRIGTTSAAEQRMCNPVRPTIQPWPLRMLRTRASSVLTPSPLPAFAPVRHLPAPVRRVLRPTRVRVGCDVHLLFSFFCKVEVYTLVLWWGCGWGCLAASHACTGTRQHHARCTASDPVMAVRTIRLTPPGGGQGTASSSPRGTMPARDERCKAQLRLQCWPRQCSESSAGQMPHSS